jgi:hypothetical protein
VDFSKTTVHCVIGDSSAEEYGGGIVFTGEYGPELWYTHGAETDAPEFDQYADDSDQDACILDVYRVDLCDSAEAFLARYDWVDWKEVCRTNGIEDAPGGDGMGLRFDTIEDRAGSIYAAAGHYGWHEFDSYPSRLSYADVSAWYEAWRVQHNARLALKAG